MNGAVKRQPANAHVQTLMQTDLEAHQKAKRMRLFSLSRMGVQARQGLTMVGAGVDSFLPRPTASQLQVRMGIHIPAIYPSGIP